MYRYFKMLVVVVGGDSREEGNEQTRLCGPYEALEFLVPEAAPTPTLQLSKRR